jgi:hypothetical protein
MQIPPNSDNIQKIHLKVWKVLVVPSALFLFLGQNCNISRQLILKVGINKLLFRFAGHKTFSKNNEQSATI